MTDGIGMASREPMTTATSASGVTTELQPDDVGSNPEKRKMRKRKCDDLSKWHLCIKKVVSKKETLEAKIQHLMMTRELLERGYEEVKKNKMVKEKVWREKMWLALNLYDANASLSAYKEYQDSERHRTQVWRNLRRIDMSIQFYRSQQTEIGLQNSKKARMGVEE